MGKRKSDEGPALTGPFGRVGFKWPNAASCTSVGRAGGRTAEGAACLAGPRDGLQAGEWAQANSAGAGGGLQAGGRLAGEVAACGGGFGLASGDSLG